MKLLLQILWGWSVLANGAVGIQVGTVQTNNQNIKLMKMNFTSPVWLQSASNVGGGKEYISFVDSKENPKIYQLSAKGDVTIQSIYNGEPTSQTVINPTDAEIQIQSDANTEVVLYGQITKLFCQPAAIGNTHLTSIDVSHAKSLTYLYCGANQLTSLDVSANTALTYLNCNSNQLTSLDVSANTALTYLDCNSNQLTSLVSANTQLTYLNCSRNQLTSLDVSANSALTELDCSYNQLTSLDVSTNTALTKLNCGANQLTSLDVSANTALTELDCYTSSQLTSLDVSANTALTKLNCSSSQLISLDVSANTALTELSCYSNPALLTIDGIGVNESVATSIASVITNATSADGTVTLRQGDEFNQTIIDAAMDKGWDVQYYQ